MSILTSAITKFGAPKIALAAFLAGASMTLPAVWATHSLWNGAVKSSKIKQLKGTIEGQQTTINLERQTAAALVPIYGAKDKQITTLTTENTRLTGLNVELSESRQGTVERIYVQGQQKKQAATAGGDKCAAAPVSDGLRIYGNGSDYFTSAMSAVANPR